MYVSTLVVYALPLLCAIPIPLGVGFWGIRRECAEQDDGTCLIRTGTDTDPGINFGPTVPCQLLTASIKKRKMRSSSGSSPQVSTKVQRGHDTLVDSVRRSSPDELLEKTTRSRGRHPSRRRRRRKRTPLGHTQGIRDTFERDQPPPARTFLHPLTRQRSNEPPSTTPSAEKKPVGPSTGF